MEAAYKDLDVVHNGGEAMRIFPMLKSMTDQNEIKRIRDGLLEYCKLDTFAMVKLLEVIRENGKTTLQ
jgi:hemerythrin superfamily protein